MMLLQTVKLLSQLLLQNRRWNAGNISGGYALASTSGGYAKHRFRQVTSEGRRWM